MAKKITPKKKAKPAPKKVTKKVVAKAKPKTVAKKAVAKPKPAPKKKVVKKVVKKAIKKVAKPVPAKKTAVKKVAIKKVAAKSKPAPKKAVAKKPVKMVATKKVVKKTVAKKVVAKKPVVKAKPGKVIARKPVVKVQVKKAVAKKPVKKVKPAPKKVVAKKPVMKKAVPVKKIVPVKKAIPVVKEVPKAVEIPVVPMQPAVEKPAAPKYIQRPKIVPMKNMQKFEANYNRADMFYKNVLKAEIVKRYTPGKDEDADFIAKDQNLTIKIADKESTISEKARDQDWNDIYVEIFHKFPDQDGWIRFTEAEYIAYFFPGRVFWAKMEPIKHLCFDILSKAIDSGIYKELSYMYPKNSGRLSKTFKINQKTYSFNFIQTYHEDGENSYYSVGISLPFVLLMDFRIDYKIFKQ